jgi:hypothetical protein
MVKNSRQSPGSDDKNFDVLGPSREQTNGSSQGATGSDAVAPLSICYGASTAQPNPIQGKNPNANIDLAAPSS